MSDALRVLVIESEPGAAATACAELEAAGHTTFHCHEPHAPTFPCNTLISGKQCPLDTVDIDVALVARAVTRARNPLLRRVGSRPRFAVMFPWSSPASAS